MSLFLIILCILAYYMWVVSLLHCWFPGGADISCCYSAGRGSWPDRHSDDLSRSEIR